VATSRELGPCGAADNGAMQTTRYVVSSSGDMVTALWQHGCIQTA
jgi:hypothetical protein